MVKYMSSYDIISTIILSVTTSAVLASMAILLSSNTSADSTSATATVTVGSACTMTATVNTAHTAEVPAGSTKTDIGSTTLKTICNDAGGYAIYAVGYSGDEYGNNKMLNGTNEINTGTGSSASNWNMSLSQVTTGTYATTIDGGFGSYSAIPSTFTKVAHRDSGTDSVSANPATGSSISLTYGAYISTTQAPGEYVGKVKFTMVHPASEIPPQPQTAISGCINYFPNGNSVVGTMGCQSISSSATSAKLFASNFSRTGYGFAGWSDVYDYENNHNANLYGPNESINFTAGTYTGSNPGLSLYAVWIKTQGTFQNSNEASTICNNLTQASTDGSKTLASVSALTDNRDNQTYAIAKLADGKCWMVENLRLDNTSKLTTLNTNNPLNDNDPVNPTVTLKHNYTDTETYNTLSASSTASYDADTAPDGWCFDVVASCEDQSRIRTINTTNRASYASNSTTMVQHANHYLYGNYYNWYSATAGNGTHDKPDGNTDGDICPSSWHLPTGTNGGEFYTLNVVVNAGSTTSDANLRVFPNNFVLSGCVSAVNSLYAVGGTGYNWTSTVSNKMSYEMHFYSNYVRPGTQRTYKYLGKAVRCIISST